MADIFEMSDDDFMRQGETLLSTSAPEEEQLADATQEEETPTGTPEDEVAEQVEEEADAQESEESATEENTEEVQESENKTEAPEQLLAKLFAPFKANGKDIKIDSVEEAIALMQMGANYSKKMAGLKPNLRVLKMLENNGLLDEAKLTYLIDLDKKNPGAINKLVKDSGVDPLSIDLDASPEYTPGQYSVSDLEMQVTDVLDNIQQTNPDNYGNILQAITSMDAVSKSEISKDPALLNHLSDHMQAGIYERITNELEKRQMLGQLTGPSWIHNYYAVGESLRQQGKLFPEVTPPKTDPIIDPAKVKPKGDSNKKRAVATPRSTPTTPKDKAFDPLAMSDEEFLRIVQNKH